MVVLESKEEAEKCESKEMKKDDAENTEERGEIEAIYRGKEEIGIDYA